MLTPTEAGPAVHSCACPQSPLPSLPIRGYSRCAIFSRQNVRERFISFHCSLAKKLSDRTQIISKVESAARAKVASASFPGQVSNNIKSNVCFNECYSDVRHVLLCQLGGGAVGMESNIEKWSQCGS